MGKLFASLLAMIPLVAAAQDAAQPPAQPSEPQYAPPPQQAPPPAQQPPQYPPQYAPPPQYTPPPPQGQSAPPQQYAPPPQYVPGQNPPAQPYRRAPYQRSSWYIGFGLGGSGGSVSITGKPASIYGVDSLRFKGDTFAGNIRVGATISPKLLVGFDGGFAGSDGDQTFPGFTDKVSLQLNYYDVGLMYFPADRGFFLRAAAGLSAVDWKDSVNHMNSGGLNVLGGIGYAFWLGQTFNLTLNLDAIRHKFNANGFESGTAWSAWVGFDWY